MRLSTDKAPVGSHVLFLGIRRITPSRPHEEITLTTLARSLTSSERVMP